MKKFILKASVILSMLFITVVCYSQTSECPLKGTPECPLLQNCTDKGTANCPLINAGEQTTTIELSECPLKGTPECPLVNQSNNTTASEKALTETDESSLPPCCRKK